MRLDVRIASLYPYSRSKSAAMVAAGYVWVNGKRITKAAEPVTEHDLITIEENPLEKYVSRGGLKLEKALEVFRVPVEHATVLDVGASTGGFTDCLLKHGAKQVIALDVGSEQLHPTLRDHPRVTVMEQTDARTLKKETLPPLDLITMDVSFISQSLLYPALSALLPLGGQMISLIKPQFEMERKGDVSKGGIVKNCKKINVCIHSLEEKAKAHHLHMVSWIPSPIEGGDGNKEFLADIRRI